MSYLGKVLGGLAGLISGKWPLVLFGVFLGHQFDRGFARYARNRMPAEFAGLSFAIMGHLAKADGRVSEDEIRLARTAMHMLNLDGDATREAMRSFNEGKQPGFNLDVALQQLHKASQSPHSVGRRLIGLLLPVILAKEEASAGERRVLWQVCEQFGIGRVELAQIEAAARVERHFPPTGRARTTDEADRAFAALGLAPDASDQQIKQAYRRLMNRYHPDKLAGNDANSEDIAAAARKTREVRTAYELLRERRGFK